MNNYFNVPSKFQAEVIEKLTIRIQYLKLKMREIYDAHTAGDININLEYSRDCNRSQIETISYFRDLMQDSSADLHSYERAYAAFVSYRQAIYFAESILQVSTKYDLARLGELQVIEDTLASAKHMTQPLWIGLEG